MREAHQQQRVKKGAPECFKDFFRHYMRWRYTHPPCDGPAPQNFTQNNSLAMGAATLPTEQEDTHNCAELLVSLSKRKLPGTDAPLKRQLNSPVLSERRSCWKRMHAELAGKRTGAHKGSRRSCDAQPAHRRLHVGVFSRSVYSSRYPQVILRLAAPTKSTSALHQGNGLCR